VCSVQLRVMHFTSSGSSGDGIFIGSLKALKARFAGKEDQVDSERECDLSAV